MSVYLTQAQVYEDRSERALRAPTPRFTELLNDLFAKFGVELEPESVMKGSQFSYLELLTKALETMPISSETEVILFTSCATEFDPKQPGMGASFMARFGLYELHAICNEGILGGFTALHLAQKIITQQNRKVCLIAIEQNTNFLPKGYGGFVPSENIVGKLDLRATSSRETPQVVASSVVHKRVLRKKLDEFTDTHGLCRKNLILHVKNEQQFFGFFGFLNDELKGCEHLFHDYPASSAQFIQCLTQSLTMTSAASSPKPFSLLLLEDVFSQNCGILLLKRGDL